MAMDSTTTNKWGVRLFFLLFAANVPVGLYLLFWAPKVPALKTVEELESASLGQVFVSMMGGPVNLSSIMAVSTVVCGVLFGAVWLWKRVTRKPEPR